ncbi:MAG: hypothetical protein RL227_938 [Pseudomonadota bacterium]|jgi:hypothetical protein
MSTSALVLASLVLLTAGALMAWVWLAMVSVDEELQRFSECDGLFGDAVTPAATERDRTRWPAPG